MASKSRIAQRSKTVSERKVIVSKGTFETIGAREISLKNELRYTIIMKRKPSKKSVNVKINVEDSTLMLLRQASHANRCTVQEATQYLVDFAQGNLCDWSNAGFPMN